jgi:VWFA-related protein
MAKHREGCALGQISSRVSLTAFLLACSIAITIPSLSIAQSPAAPIDAAGEQSNSDNAQPVAIPDGLIHIDVVVTNPSGRPVLGLMAKDFILLNNGKPSPIVSFAAFQGALRPDPPVSVVLVLDALRASGGSLDLKQIEYRQVEKFLRQNDGYLAQPTTILELTDHGLWQVGESSMNGIALADSIAQHYLSEQIQAPELPRLLNSQSPPAAFEPHMATNSPTVAALKALGIIAAIERQRPGRKLIFWIGPGWGLASGQNVNTDLMDNRNRQAFFDMTVWFSTLLRLARVSLYSFSLAENTQPASDAPPELTAALSSPHGPASPQDVTLFDLNRKMLALASGGRVIPPSADIVAEINNCLRDRNSFYALSFNPDPVAHVDEYHDLRIVIRDTKLIAHTVSGFYNEPYFSDLPDPALRSVTVAELEQLLQGAHDNSDGDLARLLNGLRLTERLSPENQAAWSAQLHGKKSREALEALAGRSAFLDPPPAEIVSNAPPDAPAQQRILAAASGYLNHAIPRLPDFFATRTSVDFIETPVFKPSDRSLTFEPLRETRRTHATVLYRNGQEVVNAKSELQDPYSLSTFGVFGPILNVVKAALSAPGSLSWLRWEKNAAGPVAVFRYFVPRAQSLYRTVGCCLTGGDGTSTYSIVPAYHGIIAVDPDSGAIMRFVLQADLDKIVPVAISAVSVTYGPVEIGGHTYVLPLQSMSLLRRRSVQTFTEWDESFNDWGPYVSTLNAFEFSNYHNFHTEMRILNGFTPAPEDNAPANPAPPPH